MNETDKRWLHVDPGCGMRFDSRPPPDCPDPGYYRDWALPLADDDGEAQADAAGQRAAFGDGSGS